MKNKYPECEKMAAVKDKSQTIGEFIHWLFNEKECVIAHYDPYEDDRGGDTLVLVQKNIETWLAEFFKINLDKVEKEKRQMLKEIRGRDAAKNK
ncbi:hypothetical protein LCGC14_0221280 [marine sediment metagenome]|uniref:Uncharacterized protein n=1 Tax=marine sediment metagenome TaxID=412755 RepID=A0A0F9UDM2_9ZZZZ